MYNKKIATRNVNQASISLDDIFRKTSEPGNISFAVGFPEENAFPIEALKSAFSDAIEKEGKNIFQYHSTQGIALLREKVAQLILSYYGANVTSDNIIMTQGGQQAIDIIGRTFLNKHDHIVVEAPTYMGALDAFDGYEPIYHEVEVQDDGININVLRNILKEFPETKFIYTVPDFQNPTGITMSVEKRKQLLLLAKEFDCYIIEDSPYRYLRYQGSQLPSLLSMDSDQRVILVSSFSKILSPALRTGFMAVKGDLIESFLSVKSALDVQSSHISLVAINNYLENNNITEHICQLNMIYNKKRIAMLTALEKFLPKDVVFTQPEGGFFIWVTLPTYIDASQLLINKMIPDSKVVYVPSEMQYSSRNIKNQFRLNFTNVSTEEIEQGIKRMSESIVLEEKNHKMRNKVSSN